MDAQQMLTTQLSLARRARRPQAFCVVSFTTFTEYPKKLPKKRKNYPNSYPLLPHFFTPYLRLLRKTVKSYPKTDYKILDYNRLHDFL